MYRASVMRAPWSDGAPDSRCSEWWWAGMIPYHLTVVLAPGPCWTWTVLTRHYKGYLHQLHACQAWSNSALGHCKHLHFVLSISTKYAEYKTASYRYLVSKSKGTGGLVSIVSYSRPSLMIIASRTQFHIERPWGQRLFSIVY